MLQIGRLKGEAECSWDLKEATFFFCKKLKLHFPCFFQLTAHNSDCFCCLVIRHKTAICKAQWVAKTYTSTRHPFCTCTPQIQLDSFLWTFYKFKGFSCVYTPFLCWCLGNLKLYSWPSVNCCCSWKRSQVSSDIYNQGKLIFQWIFQNTDSFLIYSCGSKRLSASHAGTRAWGELKPKFLSSSEVETLQLQVCVKSLPRKN